MNDRRTPGDWDTLLKRLGQTLAGVEQTLTKVADLETATSRGESAQHIVSEQAVRIEALNDKASAISHWVDALESELKVSEDLLRVLLNQTETVRQQLATWANRAIG